jgi:NAD dependent epimerase/dehydratase family enzyme
MMSWISLNDLMGVLLECMANDSLSGPVNAVVPESVSNRTFTRTLARVLGRPAVVSVPSPIVRLVAGELGDELLLVSQSAKPSKLEESGFRYAFDSLELTLRHELGHYNRQGGFDTSVTHPLQPDTRYQPELSEI